MRARYTPDYKWRATANPRRSGSSSKPGAPAGSRRCSRVRLRPLSAHDCSAAAIRQKWWAERGSALYVNDEELLDQLQAIYRQISLTLVRGAFRCWVQDRQRLWSDWFASGCGTLELVPPEQESAGEFDPMCLTMGFDALARWRASAVSAGQSARISWRTGDDQFEVSWHESGGTAHAPIRPPAQTSPGSPSLWAAHQPLALPLLARVMTAHRGTMEWSWEPEFHALLRWPLNQSDRLKAPSS